MADIAVDAVEGSSSRSSDLPVLLGEQPTEQQLADYKLTCDQKFRSDTDELLFRADPVAVTSGSFAPDPAFLEPDGISEGGKQSLILENAKITRSNAKKAIALADHLRSGRNKIAGRLQLSLRPNAPLLLKRLEAKHKYAAPYEHMFNGALMYQDM